MGRRNDENSLPRVHPAAHHCLDRNGRYQIKGHTRGFKLLDDAGENAPLVIQLLNRYGADGVWVASRPPATQRKC